MQYKVFLMGMPGCGKSTIGKRLANKLNLPFIDLDSYIEKKEQKTIGVIFKEQSENAFRDLETKYLNEIIRSEEAFFLSLGGGTPCFNNNLSIIKKKGFSIYLQLPSKALFNRIKNAAQTRPLFNGLNDDELMAKLDSLLLQREPFYAQATHTLSGINAKPDEIVEQLIKTLSTN